MFLSKSLFSELFGFVVYCPTGLQNYIEQNELGQNLLETFTSSEKGDEVTKMGIAIPILELDADDYRFALSYVEEESSLFEKHKQVNTKVKGQALHAKQGVIHICGIGYFNHWDPEKLASLGKIIEIPVKPAAYNLDILTGVVNKQSMIELRLQQLDAVNPVELRGRTIL